jgi:hypothetical protein
MCMQAPEVVDGTDATHGAVAGMFGCLSRLQVEDWDLYVIAVPFAGMTSRSC